MKKLANLKGVKKLNRMEQKSINGGGGGNLCISSCGPGHPTGCDPTQVCHEFNCFGDPGITVFYCVGEGPGEQ